MASERAKYSPDVMLSVASRTLHRSMMGVKLGAAKAASTAMMVIVTSNSMAVKPCRRANFSEEWAGIEVS